MGQGTPIQFAGLDSLLWGIVATLQYYTLPAMAIAIAGFGLGLVFSGEDIDRKQKYKSWIINILIGGLLVFGSATIANVLKSFFSGH